MPTKRPEGAKTIREAKQHHGPWYTVDSKYGLLVKHDRYPQRMGVTFPDGILIRIFTNYFHALAYSLKVKHEAKET